MGREIKSISVSREFVDLALEHRISWTEAARVGLSILLAEKGVKPYDNNLNIKRKLDNLINEVQLLNKKNSSNVEVNTKQLPSMS